MLHDETELTPVTELAPELIEASHEYVGRWNRLISTTNWEKGRIISQWRASMESAGMDPASFTDEAWAQQVGGVTPQHVGRLRRVFDRFGDGFERYPKLFWSHFCAALDWDDAEMWLEGAKENGWSISQMRDQRSEALGGPSEMMPDESEIISGEIEGGDADETEASAPDSITGEISEVRETEDEAPFGEEEAVEDRWDESSGSEAQIAAEKAATQVRPFENLPKMPADLREAFELFKMSILSHKITAWEEISQENMLRVIESLRLLATAPTE